ncbi:uncharacterized protein N7506_009760, partial [Penicillium brevicompactum]
ARPDPPGLLSFNPLLPWSYPTLHPLPFTTPGLLLKSATKHAIDSLCVITPRGKNSAPSGGIARSFVGRVLCPWLFRSPLSLTISPTFSPIAFLTLSFFSTY